MRYLGGKQRISKEVADVLNSFRRPDQLYIEPFLGGASVFSLMTNPKEGYDVVPELICMWQDVSEGWCPPSEVSKMEYTAAREGVITDGLRAFIGFGCSFGGKWFGGYAATKDGRNYAANAQSSVLKKQAGLVGAAFQVKDFFSLDCQGALIYCDPPYAHTTKPGARNSFNSDSFWDKVRQLSANNTVIVSEYTAPEDFEVIWSKPVKLDMQTKKDNNRVERLFKLQESKHGKEETER